MEEKKNEMVSAIKAREYELLIEGTDYMLIQKFMGQPLGNYTEDSPQTGPKVLISWNYIMPVVAKIQNLYDNEPEYLDEYQNVVTISIVANLYDVLTSVVEFIKWHNAQQEKLHGKRTPA